MTMGVFDFKAIANKLNCQEQKADFEEKNPKPVETAPVVWSPEWGYGVAPVPMKDLNDRADALAQHLVDCYAYASIPKFTTKI